MRLFTLLILLLSSPLWAAPEFPELTGRVVDNANLMTAAQRQSLTQALASAEQNTSNQVVVVTLADLQGYEIADYGYQLGRHWGIGSEDYNYLSPGAIIGNLCACRKVGANYLLNVGPTAGGAIPDYENIPLDGK